MKSMVLIVVSLAIAGCSHAPSEAAEGHYLRADAPSDSADLHYLYADAYFKAGEFEKAGEELEKALELDPNHAPAKALQPEVQFILGNRPPVYFVSWEWPDDSVPRRVRHEQTLLEIDNLLASGKRALAQGDKETAERAFRRIGEYSKWIPDRSRVESKAKEANDLLQGMGLIPVVGLNEPPLPPEEVPLERAPALVDPKRANIWGRGST